MSSRFKVFVAANTLCFGFFSFHTASVTVVSFVPLGWDSVEPHRYSIHDIGLILGICMHISILLSLLVLRVYVVCRWNQCSCERIASRGRAFVGRCVTSSTNGERGVPSAQGCCSCSNPECPNTTELCLPRKRMGLKLEATSRINPTTLRQQEWYRVDRTCMVREDAMLGLPP